MLDKAILYSRWALRSLLEEQTLALDDDVIAAEEPRRFRAVAGG